MSYLFKKDLFTNNLIPLRFSVTYCKDSEDLESIIKFGGGVVDGVPGPYTITLFNSGSDLSVANLCQDIFSSEFILKCCIRNCLLPLKDFLLNDSSYFTSEFDPNQILVQKMTWAEAQANFTRKRLRTVVNLDSFKNPPGCIMINRTIPVVKISDSVKQQYMRKSNEAESRTPSSVSDSDLRSGQVGRKRVRYEYTPKEQEKIVRYIVENKVFNQLKKPSMWKDMEQHFSHHSWCSLKNHFQRKIMPSIHEFDLSPKTVAMFREGMQVHPVESSVKLKRKIEQLSDSEDENTTISSAGQESNKTMSKKAHVYQKTQKVDSSSDTDSSNKEEKLSLRSAGSKRSQLNVKKGHRGRLSSLSSCSSNPNTHNWEVCEDNSLHVEDAAQEEDSNLPLYDVSDSESNSEVQCSKSLKWPQHSESCSIVTTNKINEARGTFGSADDVEGSSEDNVHLKRNTTLKRASPKQHDSAEANMKKVLTVQDSPCSSSNNSPKSRSFGMDASLDTSENLNQQESLCRSPKSAFLPTSVKFTEPPFLCTSPLNATVNINQAKIIQRAETTELSNLFEGTEFPLEIAESLLRKSNVKESTTCVSLPVGTLSKTSTVSDASVQTVPVSMFLLPQGWEYPLTFESAFKALTLMSKFPGPDERITEITSVSPAASTSSVTELLGQDSFEDNLVQVSESSQEISFSPTTESTTAVSSVASQMPEKKLRKAKTVFQASPNRPTRSFRKLYVKSTRSGCQFSALQ